jgi:hypothetical protein
MIDLDSERNKLLCYFLLVLKMPRTSNTNKMGEQLPGKRASINTLTRLSNSYATMSILFHKVNQHFVSPVFSQNISLQ